MEAKLTWQVLLECVKTMGLKQWGLIVIPAGVAGWVVGKAVKAFQPNPNTTGAKVGRVAAAAATGAVVGALIGSAILPAGGTVVGAIIGGIAGAIGGWFA